jgi:hypothetical protein
MKRPRIGERSTILGLLGVPFVIFGIGILTTNEPEQALAPTVAEIANSLFGWLWVVAGSYAIVAMFVSGTRKVIEEVGYGLLFLPPFVWMSGYLITLFYGGRFSVFVGFLVSSTVVVLILYLARHMRNG